MMSVLSSPIKPSCKLPRTSPIRIPQWFSSGSEVTEERQFAIANQPKAIGLSTGIKRLLFTDDFEVAHPPAAVQTNHVKEDKGLFNFSEFTAAFNDFSRMPSGSSETPILGSNPARQAVSSFETSRLSTPATSPTKPQSSDSLVIMSPGRVTVETLGSQVTTPLRTPTRPGVTIGSGQKTESPFETPNTAWMKTRYQKASPVRPLDDLLTPTKRRKLEALESAQVESAAVKYADSKQKKMAKAYYEQYVKSAEIKHEKKLNIVMGLPGSGKSSIIVGSIQEKGEGALLVDADEIKKMMPEYQGGKGAKAVHSTSVSIANKCMSDAMKNSDNIIYSTVGASTKGLEELISKARDKGYTIKLHLAHLSPNEAAKRVFFRMAHAAEEPSAPFQFVSPSLPLETGYSPKENFEHLKTLVDEYSVWDTEVPGGKLRRQVSKPDDDSKLAGSSIASIVPR